MALYSPTVAVKGSGEIPLTVSWSAPTLGIATGVSLSGGYKPAMASEIRGWGARQTNHGGSEDVD